MRKNFQDLLEETSNLNKFHHNQAIKKKAAMKNQASVVEEESEKSASATIFEALSMTCKNAEV